MVQPGIKSVSVQFGYDSMLIGRVAYVCNSNQLEQTSKQERRGVRVQERRGVRVGIDII
jgi:hypothetical protein